MDSDQHNKQINGKAIKDMTREEAINAFIRFNNMYEEFEKTSNIYQNKLLDQIEFLKHSFNQAIKYRNRWFVVWLVTFILMIIFAIV